MKKPTIVFMVLLFLSTSLFAGKPAKPTVNNDQPKNGTIIFSTLPSKNGISVTFKKGATGKAIVIIYDNAKNVLRKDILSDQKSLEKGYILTDLENGDYTVEVTLNKVVIRKGVHVYMEGQVKTFLIKA
ncbi:MAG TPA: hypothetical protein VFE53_01890 [Mucilaginibacter sp.]|jgi:hypothetical protein|nr:hypothetical protein [Mucilaginibacter sp.]